MIYFYMKYIAFASYEQRCAAISFDLLVAEFDDIKILSSSSSVLWNGLYLFDCPERLITTIKDKVFPYFLIMEDF